MVSGSERRGPRILEEEEPGFSVLFHNHLREDVSAEGAGGAGGTVETQHAASLPR